MCVLFQCTIFCHAQYYYQVGVFTADKFNTGVFASDIFIQAKLLSGVFTAGGITEWSFLQACFYNILTCSFGLNVNIINPPYEWTLMSPPIFFACTEVNFGSKI